MSQSLILPVAGLMTDPGPFTATPDGALVEAQNVVVLRPGVIEPRAGASWSKDAVLKAGNYEAAAIYADPNSNQFVWASSPWIIRQNASTTITGPTSFISGKIRVCPTGSRALFTSENGVCSLPGQAASPESGLATIAYRAGMPQPYAPVFATLAAPAGYPAGANWLAAGSSVAYRVTLRRRLANGTLIESAPSSRVIVAGAGAGIGVQLNDALGTGVYLAWAPNGAGAGGFNDLLTGDELCIYRSPSSTGTPSDEMRLRAVLTYDTTYNGFTVIVNGVATPWFDGLADAAWTGESLYTNSTQDGAFLANYRPEYARDIALYKNITFYAGAATAQRIDITLTKLGTTATVTDPQNAICSFAFTGDTTIATNTILNCTNIRYFSVGQVVTTTAQAPGNASATFPANTFVTAINTATNVVTLSANAGVTAVGVACVSWDWIETDVGGVLARIYHYAGVGTLPTRYFATTAASLENRWNGDSASEIQLRCTGVTQTESIVCSFYQPDCTDASFIVRTSKPLAWDRAVTYNAGVTSEPLGGSATLQWSKVNEPEHMPLPYRTVVGDAAYAIRRIVAARNSLLIFKDDGLFQCFGDTAEDLTFEALDRTITIPAPKDAGADQPCKWVGRFDDRVFAMTTRGPMAITDTGATLVGAPILESLRQRFRFAYGANDESLRALMIDTQSRRIGFFYDANGLSTAGTSGYVLDVETGTWVYWTWPYPIADFDVLDAFGAPVMAGAYRMGLILDSRTMLASTPLTLATLPPTCEQWSGETASISAIHPFGSDARSVTLTAGSEWTPVVGDLFVSAGAAYEVVSVTSPTLIAIYDPAGAVNIANPVTWRESYEARVVWSARSEGNPAAEKHWLSLALPFEKAALLSRIRSYFSGYRNTSTALEDFAAASQTVDNGPWPLIPGYTRVSVATAFGRDWAIKVGFSIRQACVWFSTSGASVLWSAVSPDKVSR